MNAAQYLFTRSPRDTLRELNRSFKVCRLQRDPDLATRGLWTWSSTTAWRRVKEVMEAAKISGAPAMTSGCVIRSA